MSDLSAADKILAAVRAIPHGQVAGYGEVARRARRTVKGGDIGRELNQIAGGEARRQSEVP